MELSTLDLSIFVGFIAVVIGVSIYSSRKEDTGEDYFLAGSITDKSGKVYHKHYGFCLETQHFPDSPNRPNFPSVILKPGDKYTHTTVHKFSAK